MTHSLRNGTYTPDVSLPFGPLACCCVLEGFSDNTPGCALFGSFFVPPIPYRQDRFEPFSDVLESVLPGTGIIAKRQEVILSDTETP